MAAVAAFITVATNLYIHLTDFPSSTFNERILLFQNKAYIFNRIIIIVHCLLVIISMTGMALLLARASNGFAVFGALSFIIFGITETARMVISLNYVNGLRKKYFHETNTEVKQLLAYSLDNVSFINNLLFNIFIVAFAFGCLWFGIILSYQPVQRDKLFGFCFVLLSAVTFLAFANDFMENSLVSKFVHWSSITLQPLVRLWAGVWIIQNALNKNQHALQ